MTENAWNPDHLTKFFAGVQDVIARQGWAVQYVFPTREDPVQPFAYTVGLTSFGRPELIVVGLPPDIACLVLNHTAQQHITHPVSPGDTLRPGLSVPLRAVYVPKSVQDQCAGVARSLYGDTVTLVQLMWPSNTGRWPDHPDWDGEPGQQDIPT